jgi:hypothetical protein
LDVLPSQVTHAALEFTFSDLTYWIVSIGLPGDGDEDEEAEKALQREAATMRLINKGCT